jgi:hypothetical protein
MQLPCHGQGEEGPSRRGLRRREAQHRRQELQREDGNVFNQKVIGAGSSGHGCISVGRTSWKANEIKQVVRHSLGKKEELVQGKMKQAGRQAGRRGIGIMLAGRNVRSVVRAFALLQGRHWNVHSARVMWETGEAVYRRGAAGTPRERRRAASQLQTLAGMPGAAAWPMRWSHQNRGGPRGTSSKSRPGPAAEKGGGGPSCRLPEPRGSMKPASALSAPPLPELMPRAQAQAVPWAAAAAGGGHSRHAAFVGGPAVPAAVAAQAATAARSGSDRDSSGGCSAPAPAAAT